MPTALISVSDKSDLIDKLAKPLYELGWKIIASGGTAAKIRESGISVTDVAEYTKSPEILDGRVKTLHPAIHGGILSRAFESDAADLKMINAEQIDLVAVNLYPFQNTVAKEGVKLEEAVEKIDIGGVALIRAAAKNFERLILICDPADYSEIVTEIKTDGKTSLETRRKLSVKGFAHTMQYDTAIYKYLSGEKSEQVNLYPIQELRYGENPHQEATLYGYEANSGPLGGKQIQGKALSYNNLLDLDAAWRAAVSFDKPTVCIVKHLSPCGLASGNNLSEAYPPALASDPISAFGGVIAVNREFDYEIANLIGDMFIECIIASGFSEKALERLSEKKNLRVVKMPDNKPDPSPEMRSIVKGVLKQTIDLGDPTGIELKVVTNREPTAEEMRALKFAWKACQHVKSNAIVFAKGEATIGIGGGQPNRVDCVGIAAQRAGENSKGAAMASDAFFPFPDTVEAAIKHGITAIIQPGGSQRDQLSIDCANENDIAMVFTGYRHFRH